MFSIKDIADYYDQTEVHYKQWWKLDKSMALHYGIWEKDTKSFAQSLRNTSRILSERAGISATDTVLDAGCGIGGCAIFLAKDRGAKITGITLSAKQVNNARKNAVQHHVEKQVVFSQQDYTNTAFEDNSFDVVWACESFASAIHKEHFVKEVYRVLKKGGRLIIADYFLSENIDLKEKYLIEKWIKKWAITEIITLPAFVDMLSTYNFDNISTSDETKKIHKTAKRMYFSFLLGAIPSLVYNSCHSTSRFAEKHYLSGYYQYITHKKRLWKYNIVLAYK